MALLESASLGFMAGIAVCAVMAVVYIAGRRVIVGKSPVEPEIALGAAGKPAPGLLKVLIPPLAGGVIVGTATWFALPTRFVASAWFRIDAATPSIAFPAIKDPDAEYSYRFTQGALLKSRVVLVAALRPQKVAELNIVKEQTDPVAWLDEQLTVDFGLSNEIMRIQMQGDNPRELVTILDSVVSAYMDEVAMNDRKRLQDKRDAIQAQASLWDERLRIKRRTYRDIAEVAGSNNVFSVKLKQQYQNALLNDKEKELIHLDRDLRRMRLEAIGEDAKIKAAKPEPDETVVKRLILEDPAVKRLDALILETQEKVWTKKKEDNLQDEMKHLQASRMQLIESKRAEIERQVVHTMQDQSKEKIRGLRERIVLSEALQKDLQEEVQRLRNEMHGSQSGAFSLETAKEENDQTEAISKKLHELLAQMEVEASAPPRVSVWDKADFRMAQSPLQVATIACGGGVAAMLVIIVLQLGYWSLGKRK
jgi:hypothetical protein